MSAPLRVTPRPWSTRSAVVWLAAMLVASGGQARAEEVHYNRQVLPILAEKCLSCHGFDRSRREAGLRLDSAAGASAVLESGARAIVPGQPGESALIARIFATDAEERMPPVSSGKQLTAAEQETLRLWVEQGARYEAHWSFIPPQRVAPPTAAVEDSIDHFILTRLAQEGIEPAAVADRPTLIRRLSFDLIGLPPTPLEVDAFVHDPRADAYERVVDRLLGSEHFGERWARWWLDLAHYADSDGYLQDFIRPTAWRYRQWVVGAFNDNMPFDRFTIEQLAGDLLPGASESQRIATGFLRNTLSNREGGADLEEYRVRQVTDRAATVGTTWLGLTLGCAECHDHKFDAISQREFYQLYAFFNGADEVNIDAPLPQERAAWERAKAEYDRQRAALIEPVATQLTELQADWERHLLEAELHPGVDFVWDRSLEVLGLTWGQGFGEGQLEGVNIIKTPPAERTDRQRERLLDYFLANAPDVYTAKLAELKAVEWRAKLAALKKELPPISRAPVMARAAKTRPTHIHVRGDFHRHGEEVTAGTPAALPMLPPDETADRLALARWLVAGQHPLTARVAVNRLWQELFGRGLVGTSDNFGVRGDRPTHPELLDWLAIEFQTRRWNIKEMLRLMVLSDAYRQSSKARPELAARDPNNLLVARQVRWRLGAEAVRDNALAVSGLLCRTIGGPSVKPPQPASVTREAFANKWEISLGSDRYRRGIYTFIQRTSPFAQFVTFDLPDTSRCCTRRERSNSPLQAFNLLNDPVFIEAAQSLARHVLHGVDQTDDSRLNQAFLLVLARQPESAERLRLQVYLDEQKRQFAGDEAAARQLTGETASGEEIASRAAWTALCSVLLNLEEAITRE